MIVKTHRLHRCGDMRVFHIYVQLMKESILECFTFEGEKENTKLPDMFVACVTNTLACWPFSIWLQVYPILWGFPKSWGYPHLSSIYRSFFHYKPSILDIYRWIFHEINLYWVPHYGSPPSEGWREIRSRTLFPVLGAWPNSWRQGSYGGSPSHHRFLY